MRLEHATMQLPDLIHFPFLHGIEGKKDPQCSFASTLSTAASATAGLIQHNASRVIHPRYRRLVWGLCDEDLQVSYICTAPTRWEDDFNYDSDSSDYSMDHGEVDIDLGPALELLHDP